MVIQFISIRYTIRLQKYYFEYAQFCLSQRSTWVCPDLFRSIWGVRIKASTKEMQKVGKGKGLIISSQSVIGLPNNNWFVHDFLHTHVVSSLRSSLKSKRLIVPSMVHWIIFHFEFKKSLLKILLFCHFSWLLFLIFL